MTAQKPPKFYAVARGRRTGVFTDWPTTASLVKGYPGARYKGFTDREAAEAFLRGDKGAAREAAMEPAGSDDRLVVYTDGGARGNPGPGGYGAVIVFPEGPIELYGGYRLTTNNRMELTACIAALERLPSPTRVALHTDSAYVVNAMIKGWARGWRRKGWIKADGRPALNPDLWERLLDLCKAHDVRFVKVKGHAGVVLNERCDALANAAMDADDLPADTVYEKMKMLRPGG
jgi:ribonuclease HI